MALVLKDTKAMEKLATREEVCATTTHVLQVLLLETSMLKALKFFRRKIEDFLLTI